MNFPALQRIAALAAVTAAIGLIATTFPLTTRAQFDISEETISNVPGGGSGGSGGGGEVPVNETILRPFLQKSQTLIGTKTGITATKTTQLSLKSVQDAAITALLKKAITLVRDIVIRWIVTGRFDAPVFSGSFRIDLEKSAENAARVFLSKLTGINFCQGFALPSLPVFSANFDFSIACTVPPSKTAGRATVLDMILNPGNYSDLDRFALLLPENSYPEVLVRTAEAKAEAETKAREAFANEYQAGSGFLGIRDPETGKITTPGKYVGDLVRETQIVSPQRAADVANTVQQAVDAILEAAVRTVIERGLANLFSPETGEFAPPPPPIAPLSPPSPLPLTAPSLLSSCPGTAPVIGITWDPGGRPLQPTAVDIDDDTNFGNGFWSLTVATGTVSIVAPAGFGPTDSAAGPLVLMSGNTYRARFRLLTSKETSPTAAAAAANCTAPAPTVNLTLTPNRIPRGESSIVAWTTGNADALKISGIGAVTPGIGNQVVSPENTTTYVATASGPGGVSTATVVLEVTVIPGPTFAGFCGGPNAPQGTLSWGDSSVERALLGFRVDVDSDANFGNGFWTKNAPNTVASTESTAAPGGFFHTGATGGALSFTNASTYRARVFYVNTGDFTQTAVFTVPDCTPEPPPPPGGGEGP